MSTLTSPRPAWPQLLVFLAVVIGVGGLIGYATAPGTWYQSLAKPAFNPPNWVFGPVWFFLYVLIAVAGWGVFTRAPRSAVMALWVAQMLLNWLWSPVCFGLHQTWTAFAIIVALLAAIAAFIVLAWRVDRIAAWLFVPYAAWVAFATVLNFSIATLN